MRRIREPSRVQRWFSRS